VAACLHACLLVREPISAHMAPPPAAFISTNAFPKAARSTNLGHSACLPACPAGLDLIEPLASTSGGSLLLYASPEAAPLPQVCAGLPACLAVPACLLCARACAAHAAPLLLPPPTAHPPSHTLPFPPASLGCVMQDVYKSLSQPRAFACMLRLRCSPELRLAGHHGRLVADRHVTIGGGAAPWCVCTWC
jgi:hypothetical protein